MLLKKPEIIDSIFQKSYDWVQDAVVDFIDRNMEIDRLSQLGYVLLRTTELLPEQYPQKQNIIDDLFTKILEEQKEDGGWKDVEETMWALAVLKYSKRNIKSLNDGYGWLEKQKNSFGGWGRNSRDCARIPVTCRIAILHSHICKEDDFNRVLSELYDEVLDKKNTFLK